MTTAERCCCPAESSKWFLVYKCLPLVALPRHNESSAALEHALATSFSLTAPNVTGLMKAIAYIGQRMLVRVAPTASAVAGGRQRDTHLPFREYRAGLGCGAAAVDSLQLA